MGSTQKNSAAWAVSEARHQGVFEQYRQGMAALCEIEGVEEADRPRFYNRSGMMLSRLGVVGWGDSSGQTMVRDRRLTRRSDIDGLNLLINMAPVTGDCADRSLATRAGDVLFRDLSRPSVGRYERVRLTTLMIPRQFIPPALVEAALHGHVLRASTEAGRVLGGHMRLLSQLGSSLSEEQLEAGVRAALVLAARGVGEVRALAPEEETALRLGLRWRAARIIERRLLDTSLTPDAIARMAGGSRATLYRAFEAEGGVGRYIQSRRLERAYRHLLSDDGPRRIGEVAAAFGFSSQPHFSRLFRAQFGCAPSSVGPDWADPGAEVGPGASARMRHREAVDWLRALNAGG